MIRRGLADMLRHLGLLDGAVLQTRQLQFDGKGRREIRPQRSGYLVSRFERPEDLCTLIRGGTALGEIVDPYTYEVVEELVAPFDGYLFFSRHSGLVGGGTQAFALAEVAAARWLE